MQYYISFLFFSRSKVQHNNLWKWSLLNKEKEKREKGHMVGMEEEKIGIEEWYLAKNLSLWSCELPYVAPLYLKVVCKCKWWCCHHLTSFCIVQSSNYDLFYVSFLLFTHYLFCHFTLVFIVTPFILVLQTRFNVSSSMLLFSICKIFKFKWWYHDHLAILNIATSFINDLF